MSSLQHQNDNKSSGIAGMLSEIARIRVPLPAIREVGSLLDVVYDHRLAASMVGSIVGHPLVGKSTAIQLALRERAHIKTVAINLLPRSMARDITAQIAEAIEAPGAFAGRISAAANLLARLFTPRAIDMLVIDGAEKLDPSEDAEWVQLIAGLVLCTNVAVILSGRPTTIDPTRTLAHALGRQQQTCEVHAFPVFGDKDIERFQACLTIMAAEISEIVGPPFNPLALDTEDCARRMLAASRGRIGNVSLLVQAAVREALIQGDFKLRMDHFAGPWRRIFAVDIPTAPGLQVSNPFSGSPPGLEQIRKVVEATMTVEGSRDDLEYMPKGPGSRMYGRR
jgi:hypothetical protein